MNRLGPCGRALGASPLRRLSLSAHPHANKRKNTLAIRRETVNAWERRAPLAPKHVRQLVSTLGTRVIIQPSNRRAYPMQEYINAGAIVQEDISEAPLIMGVKQVPNESLLPDTTYAFFSHTIKAQKDNMDMLDVILVRNIRLVDYEKMVDSRGARLVAFGVWAGYCGIIDILHGLGLRLLALGHHTPFLHIGLAHNYRDKHMALNGFRDAGYEIALDMMPRSLGPLTFVFTGAGNVSRGAMELFESFPHEYVQVENLPQVAKHGRLDRLYGCVVSREDHMVRKEGGPYDAAEFYAHPELYASSFAKKIAPYASVIINGVFWTQLHPRLCTIPDAKMLLAPRPTGGTPGCPTLPHRLLAICDISADPGGSIEFVSECTTIDRPFAIYDADRNAMNGDFNDPAGLLVCSIDNMPAQMPMEATEYFGDKLLPFVPEMLQSDARAPFEDYHVSPVVRNAVIASNGSLTENFQYIAELRRQQHLNSAHKMGRVYGEGQKKVLLLGAGMVSGPVVDYLGKQKNVSVTVASSLQEEAEKLATRNGSVDPVIINVAEDGRGLEELVSAHDVVISLLPYSLHPKVAELAIKHSTDMVTSSYASEAMKSLHSRAQEAGITIVNEVGLDPGIDHLLAMELIDDVHQKGGKVRSFISFCGGLPAPEFSENPLRYKFSWSPKGVLLALNNPARYLQDGAVVDIGAGEVLEYVQKISFMPGFDLVGYPNRDSTVYTSLYGIESEVRTMLRGSLRYRGFVEAVQALRALGLLGTEALPCLDPEVGPDVSWKEVVAALLHQREDIFEASLRSKVADQFGEDSLGFRAVEGLGLLSERSTAQRHHTPVDSLTALLAKRLSYQPKERDMVLLRHDIGVEWATGETETQHVDLVRYGAGEGDGDSAMAQTVGYTAAITAQMLLSGEIQRKGCVLPLTKDIYRPLLRRLDELGIKARTHITKHH